MKKYGIIGLWIATILLGLIEPARADYEWRITRHDGGVVMASKLKFGNDIGWMTGKIDMIETTLQLTNVQSMAFDKNQDNLICGEIQMTAGIKARLALAYRGVWFDSEFGRSTLPLSDIRSIERSDGALSAVGGAGALIWAVKPEPGPSPSTTARPSPEATPAKSTTPAPVRQTSRGESAVGTSRTVDLGGGVKLDLAWIPAGSFTMGSPAGEKDRGGDEGPQHRVAFAQGFWMGQTEVTQAQYEQVMGRNPSKWKGADLPVENVSWNDAQEFCREASRILGAEVRLPSEAEWEYACRAGTTTPFHYGDSLDSTMANFAGNYPYGNGRKGEYRQRTIPVKSFRPNAWGLFDMHGNVWEWCEDCYHDTYNGAPTDGTAWLSPSGSSRVLRGGSWSFSAWGCRSAYRGRRGPGGAGIIYGFRVVVMR